MNTSIKVELDDYMGSDLKVVNCARRSFGRKTIDLPDGSLKEDDINLLRFLSLGMSSKSFQSLIDQFKSTHDPKLIQTLMWRWRNCPVHDTPFNHCFITFNIEAPIYVARQLVKHEYLIMSEFSRRYITSGVEQYTPEGGWRLKPDNVKQGSSNESIISHDLTQLINNHRESSLMLYEKLINDYKIAPELARGELPQSTMTSWTWSGSLGAFAKMCRERLSEDAQLETRLVAQGVQEHLNSLYPHSSKFLIEGAFTNFGVGATVQQL